jgi:hypothetical protein
MQDFELVSVTNHFYPSLIFWGKAWSQSSEQGDQIGRNFAIWAIFYGQIFSRKNCPMIWAKF